MMMSPPIIVLHGQSVEMCDCDHETDSRESKTVGERYEAKCGDRIGVISPDERVRRFTSTQGVS